MEYNKLLRIAVFFVLGQFSCGTFVDGDVDLSPFCEDLARITTFCDEIYGFMLCRKTCNLQVPLKCGVRKFGTKIPETHEPTTEDEENIVKIPKRFRRIVGGAEAVRGSWPWTVSLRYKGVFKCLGSVISSDWVLTAASCFDADFSSNDRKDWEIVAGDHKVSDTTDSEQATDIKKIFIHPKNFKFWKIGYVNIPDDFDVALLKVEHPLQLTDYVSPVCLINPSDNVDSKSQCRVNGWGKSQSSHIVRDIPREASVKLVSRTACNDVNVYNGTIHHRAICGRYEATSGGQVSDACNQDNGGSLSCKTNGRWSAVGLISWGYKCGVGSPYGVFTNLRLMKTWIIETILGYSEVLNEARTMPDVLENLNPKVKRQNGDIF